ncbi:MAG: cupin domain-containing protein [Planctomycetales bacterium]|nr:cupin domain-containing protein [Planctomycetales bacterium]
MAIEHARPGQLIDIGPYGDTFTDQQTHTVVKTSEIEIIRLVLPKGKDIATHSAPRQLIVQCLEGHVQFSTMGNELTLRPGSLFYLPPGEPHSLRAIEDSSLLLTMLLPKK